jgi:hypothetical protein
MPAPRWVARANKAGLNRVTKFVASWAPGWAVVVHRGRKSGKTSAVGFPSSGRLCDRADVRLKR